MPNISGIALAKRSPKPYGLPSTLTTSRNTALAAIVPRVLICATESLPYLLVTYSSTLSRPSIQKSISKSGLLTLSGFKNLSNRRSYLMGSIAVIPKAYATIEPAPEPLPGPTGISFF